MSTWSYDSVSTVCSQEPNVAMPLPDEPHATSSIDGSIWRMARAASAAIRPYS